MKRIFWLTILFLVLNAAMTFAQTSSVSGFVGATSDRSPTYMVMADFGTGIDVEPWIQTYGPERQVGVDLIVMPKNVGLVVGLNSGEFGGHAGLAFNLKGLNVRLMAHTSGAFQTITFYNINLGPRFYVQLWAAPATDVSSYLVGLGYTFKK